MWKQKRIFFCFQKVTWTFLYSFGMFGNNGNLSKTILFIWFSCFHFSLTLSLCNWTENNLEQLKNGSTAYSSIIHSCDGFETFRIEFTIVEIFINTQKWMNHEPKRSQSICYWFIYSKDYIMRKITLLPFFPVYLLWFELFSYLMFILFDVRIHMNW